jgi:hypothetical protein
MVKIKVRVCQYWYRRSVAAESSVCPALIVSPVHYHLPMAFGYQSEFVTAAAATFTCQPASGHRSNRAIIY